MNREIRIVETADDLAHAAAAEFAAQAGAAVSRRGTFTVALSGGSTPKHLYEVLAADAEWRATLPWRNIHFFWGDERHVPPNDARSNFRMAQESLLSKVAIPAENIHRIRTETSDAGLAADHYEQELRLFFQTAVGQLPQFDLVLLGLGTDGHTASLFPNSPALHEMERWVCANWVKSLGSYRITMTLPILNNALSVIFLVERTEKADIVREVLADGATAYPVQLIQPTAGNVIWLLDREAAKGIQVEH